MILCPKGSFWMGSNGTRTDQDADENGKHKHKILINADFWMGETQVTQTLWQEVMGGNPSYSKVIGELPIERVTWYDCLVFCNRLSKMTGYQQCYQLSNYVTSYEDNHLSLLSATVKWNPKANGFRLPTEAEWEYCAKAGTDLTYSGSNNINDVAWYNGNSRKRKYLVKAKNANQWGLYDMSGNVWEWCMDKVDTNAYQSERNSIENLILLGNLPHANIVRGGSFQDYAIGCRVDARGWYDAHARHKDLGFRLLRCEP